MKYSLTTLSFVLILLSKVGFVAAQQTTISDSDKPKNVLKEEAKKKHKILLIPFEPKMYMSQIDHKINAETKLSQAKIRESFRFGTDDELFKKLKTKFDVVSLLDDTVKYKKDLTKIYQYLSYKYEKVPDQNNYKAPKDEKNKNGIKNGQIVTESPEGEHFMNAKITNAALIPTLYKKFNTDVYLFINQIDIISLPPGNESPAVLTRKLTLHYTVFTVDAKEINSGVCSIIFPESVNKPDKILTGFVSKIAEEITKRIDKVLNKTVK